jgi:transglutaminase/protease-like cytokinesis protein 3
MRHFLFVLVLSATLQAYAQKEDGFITAEKILVNAPDSVFNSTSSFAGYLDNHFDNDEDVLRGIFVWIAKSVSYDIENIYQIHYSEQPGELVEKTFLTRKAICQGYAELFNELCHQTGIQSSVVHGYTKQNGSISNAGHAWVVAKSNDTWYCFDPTWGAGYIMEGKFVRSFSPEYFMAYAA